MMGLREKVARAIAKAAHGLEYPAELYLDEADAAIAAVLEALKEPSEAMVEAYNRHDLSFVQSGYHDLLRTFTRDHYLSALAEEDGKEL